MGKESVLAVQLSSADVQSAPGAVRPAAVHAGTELGAGHRRFCAPELSHRGRQRFRFCADQNPRLCRQDGNGCGPSSGNHHRQSNSGSTLAFCMLLAMVYSWYRTGTGELWMRRRISTTSGCISSTPTEWDRRGPSCPDLPGPTCQGWMPLRRERLLSLVLGRANPVRQDEGCIHSC